MKKISVRCWRIENWRANSNAADELFIAYPEGNSGHDLITCLRCGEVYAVTIAKEIYIGPPRHEKLRELNCKNCGADLASNHADYPENYVVADNVYHCLRPQVIPSDEDALVVEFWGIYE